MKEENRRRKEMDEERRQEIKKNRTGTRQNRDRTEAG
jgi:hypothetical protein